MSESDFSSFDYDSISDFSDVLSNASGVSMASISDIEENIDMSDYDVLISKLKTLYTRHNLSLKCLEDIANFGNSFPGSSVQIPTTKYTLIKAFTAKSKYVAENYVQCDICAKYVKSAFGSSKSVCSTCNIALTPKETNFFVHIRITEQLKDIVQKYWNEICAYLQQCKAKKDTNIRDIYDGELIKNMFKNSNNILSLVLNTDGASVHKSNSFSLTPIQFYCNFLPPELRYRQSNVIVSLLHYSSTKNKPDPLKVFVPLVEEMQVLQSRGFTMNNYVFKVFITHCSLDLPAKSCVQGIKQYNGYNACTYCHHPGTAVERTVKYTAEVYDPRNHHETLIAMDNIRKGVTSNLIGVKNISPMISFEAFDIIHSFSIDYMHCILLGVVRLLLDLWLDPSSKGKGYYIKKKHRKILDKRLISIKPSMYLNRKPRPLDERANYKASELRNMLLYYLRVCLPGIQNKKYVDHFHLLSSAVYILLSTNISMKDLNVAEERLYEFSTQFQVLYGKENMNMNVHLTSHITKSVKNLGPLWSHSMFTFESNNGNLVSFVKGKKDILKQITTKYLVKKTIQFGQEHQGCDLKPKKKAVATKNINLQPSEQNALNIKNISLGETATIFTRIQRNEIVYTSLHHTRATKSIDYFLLLSDGSFGKAKFYLSYCNNDFVLYEQFLMLRSMDHISEVYSTGNDKVAAVDAIIEKFIYMEIGTQHFISLMPNAFEKD